MSEDGTTIRGDLVDTIHPDDGDTLEVLTVTGTIRRAIMKIDHDTNKIKELDSVIEDLVEALAFYANPETYHAVGFLFDHPSGDFKDDFSHDDWMDYDRPMAGKHARDALIQTGDLYVKSRTE